MRKQTMILITSVVFFTAACGPSAKEHEALRIADSVGVADSLAKVQAGIVKDLSMPTRTPADKKFIKTAETKFLVGNVRTASDRIEDLVAGYSGYVTHSDLGNYETDRSRVQISRDSVVILKKIVVRNHMIIKVPNEHLDSLIRHLNELILFLDSRSVHMDDVSFTILSNQKEIERLGQNQAGTQKQIDQKPSKLKEAVSAEDRLTEKKNKADQLQVENLWLSEQVNYCTLIIDIYQKPIYYKEMQVLPNYESFRPHLVKRIISAIVEGWILCEYIIVFLFEIWWLYIIIVIAIIGYRLLSRQGKPKA